MHKLRRMHIANAGYKSAFFEGETWRFCDNDSGQPVDTVLYAGNGSGKTTSLALLFSVIDTSLNRFLRRLIHSHESFDQYFNDEPGLVALEWDRGKDDKGRPIASFVTAQIVTKRRDGAEKKTDRLFIAFKADKRFGFDSLPFTGLGRTYEKRLRARDEVFRWLMECIHLYQDSHSFYRTDNQGDWQKHLEESGIDVVLLSKQVDLNRHEGGLDEFLKFPNEKSFLDRFLGLALNEERVRLIREDLREGISKLAGYDVLRDRLAMMRSLEESHVLFRDMAYTYQARVKEMEDARAEAAGLRMALTDRAETLASELEVLRKDEDSATARIREDKQRLRELEDERSACEFEIKRRVADRASREHEELERARNDAGRRLDHLRAALEWKPIEKLENEIKELQETLLREEKSLEVPKKAAESAGSELVAALEWHIEMKQVQTAALGSKKREMERSARECRKNLQEIDRAIQQERESLGGVNEWLKNFDSERCSLMRRGDLREDERSTTALLRCDAEIKRADEELESIRARLSAIAGEYGTLNETQGNLRAEEGVKDGALKGLRSSIEEGKDKKRGLAADPFILKVCREDVIDLESTAVQKLLIDFRDTATTRVLETQRLMDIKMADADSISRSGLAAIDENTDHVVTFLGGKGIRDAIPYPTWLANLEWEPQALREFVMADPARFTGVAVQGAEAFEKARNIDFAQLKLTRPVVISQAVEEPGGMAPTSFVVPVNREEAYDLEKARKLAENIEKEISDLSEAIDHARQDYEAAGRAINDIVSFSETWGQGKLELLESQHSALEREIREISEKIDAVRLSINMLQTEQADKGRRWDRLNKAVSGLRGTRDRLQDFRERWEELSEKKLEERDRISRRIEELENRLADLRIQQDGIQLDIERIQEELKDKERERNELELERDQVQMHSAEGGSLADPERLDELRVRYRQREENYRTIMQGRFGVLQGKYEEKVATRKERLAHFKSRHGSCGENEVRELAGHHNLDNLFREGEKSYEQLREKAAEKAFEKKAARKAFISASGSLTADARSLVEFLREKTHEALVDRVEGAKAEKDGIDRSLPAMQEHLAAIKEQIGKTQSEGATCRSYLNALPEIEPGRVLKISLELNEDALSEQVKKIRDRLQNASGAVEKTKAKHSGPMRVYGPVSIRKTSAGLNPASPEIFATTGWTMQYGVRSITGI